MHVCTLSNLAKLGMIRKKMKEKHESRQRSPLKYVKLVSSNEGNGKKERVGRREIFVERERKGSDNSKR